MNEQLYEKVKPFVSQSIPGVIMGILHGLPDIKSFSQIQDIFFHKNTSHLFFHLLNHYYSTCYDAYVEGSDSYITETIKELMGIGIFKNELCAFKYIHQYGNEVLQSFIDGMKDVYIGLSFSSREACMNVLREMFHTLSGKHCDKIKELYTIENRPIPSEEYTKDEVFKFTD